MGLRCVLRPWLTAVTALLVLVPHPQAWAWGSEGHRIIADIAWDHLDRSTRSNLREFLGNNDLASISTWADDIRKARPETGPWHYVDIPSDSGGYQPKDCPDDNCVVAQIDKFARILGDPDQPFAARSEALKYLVHFVGDLSQPFHAMGDARGGNDIPVTVFGSAQCGDYPCNLHSGLGYRVDPAYRRARTPLRPPAGQDDRRGPSEGRSEDPVAWANQSLQLAKQAWVQPQTEIDQAYYERERPVVDRQLALAGLRLAQVLNEKLGN